MIYRVCYETATGRIIETQSGGDPAPLQTLIDNVVNSGWSAAAVTCVYRDDAQYAAAQTADPVLTATRTASKAKADKVLKAKGDLTAMIALQESDKTKVKITDILDRLTLIETALNLR